MINSPIIELHGIARTYPGSPPVEALRPCDLSVLAGDFITVVGPSGSGKSTLLNLLGLLDRATTGKYRFDGIDVSGLRERERTALRGRKIGFVFQSFQLLDHRPAIENVMLSTLYRGSRASLDKESALQALEAVGLRDKAQAIPSRLSGGERQRVAIARALTARPRVLLCDEPTGNLDSATSESILRLFEDLNRDGITILLITHDADVAARGRRRIEIRDGCVVEVSASKRAGA